MEKKKAGYEYLLAYKISIPIYDYTVAFCKQYRNLLSSSRTFDQMIQAARNGMQNIAEGNKQQSLAGYIKLSGVARGSLEELLKDYLAYARQNRLEIWPAEKTKREIRKIREIWEILRKTPTLPDSPNFPNLPNNSEIAINLMITLINQANYLLDKLIKSLEEKFVKEDWFRENLFRKRMEAKRKQNF